jgi:hypothetical protein
MGGKKKYSHLSMMLKYRKEEAERMSAMSDEAMREAAAGRKESAAGGGGKKRSGNIHLASGEFLYLIDRIDRLDEKLTSKIDGRIDALDEKVTVKIDNLNDRFTAVQQWMVGLIIAVLVGAGAIVITLLHP